jgi:3-oxoadipate enol-lactonase
LSNTPIQYGYAQAGDIRIAYQVSGQGPALICCHPMGWDHSIWDDHRALFSNSHTLISFDQRGCGDSDHPPFDEGSESAYTVDCFADDLRAVLDELGIERARVLGFSMGVVAALRFAIRWPERVEQLVLVSAMASRLPAEIIQRARLVEDMLQQRGLEETYKFYFSGPIFEDVANNDGFSENIARLLSKATPHGFQGCFRVTIDRPSMVDELHKVTAPTLILVGERDIHYLDEADLLAQKIPDARKFIVENTGHPIAVQAPAVFQGQVMEFLGMARC